MYHGNSLRFQGSYNYIRFFGCSRPFHSYNWDVRIHMKTHISIWKFTTDKAFRLVLNWCWCLIGSWFRRGNQCFVVTTGYRNIPNTHTFRKFHHSPWDNLWVLGVVSQGGWKGCYITLCRWDGGVVWRVENLRKALVEKVSFVSWLPFELQLCIFIIYGSLVSSQQKLQFVAVWARTPLVWVDLPPLKG